MIACDGMTRQIPPSYCSAVMAKKSTPKHGITPPKGRPTRSRTGRSYDRRVFGPVWQWIAFALFLTVLFIVLVMVTNGGDFNPFNQDTGQSGAPTAPAVIQPDGSGGLSHWM